MSHVPTILHAPDVRAAAPRAKSVYGILSATVAVIASLLTATVLSRSPVDAEQHHAAVARTAPVATAATPGTGVPEASTVFNGKDMPVEEPAPTF